MRITKNLPETVVSLVVLISIFLVTFVILWTNGLPQGHDSYAHMTYTKIFLEAFEQGQFPVRWIEWITPGFGQPLFNHYQVGFYYLAALINLFSPNFNSTLTLAVLIPWWIGTVFILLLAKKYGTLPALLATLIYTFSPYLILDIFIRASYPELMAISFIPAVFWAADRLITTNKFIYLPLLAIFFGIVTFSHLPTLIIFLPIILGFLLKLTVTKPVNIKTLAFCLGGFLLGIGLAAFYLLPALLELDQINIQLLTTQHFDYRKNFLNFNNIFSFIWGYNGSWQGFINLEPRVLGIYQWVILTFSTLFLLITKDKKKYLVITFWVGCILWAVFMSHQSSYFIWQDIKFFSFIQFPWRFFMITPLSFALLSSVLIKRIKSNLSQLIIIIVFLLPLLAVYPQYLLPKQKLDRDFWNLNFTNWTKHPTTLQNAFIEQGYYPKGVKKIPSKNLSPWEVGSSGREINEEINKFHYRTFNIESDQSSTFIINTHYAQGWKAYLDGQEILIQPTDDGYYFMEVTVLPGNHNLEFKLTNNPIKFWANIISATSILIVISLLVSCLIKKVLLSNYQSN